MRDSKMRACIKQIPLSAAHTYPVATVHALTNSLSLYFIAGFIHSFTFFATPCAKKQILLYLPFLSVPFQFSNTFWLLV